MRTQSGWILRTLAWLVLLAVLALGAVAAFAWQQHQRFVDTPLALPQPDLVVEVRRGDAFRRVVQRLREAGIDTGHELHWQALAWRMDVGHRIHAGEYRLQAGITPPELLAKMARGEVVQYRFTLVEGWNFRELRQALAANDVLVQRLPELSDEALMAAIDREGVHPEGRFLPETYQFTRGTSDVEILRRANRDMERVLAAVWETRQPDLPIGSAEEALILASLIEKETGVPAERREIAGVFTRRLRIGMRLQTDPSVIYGMGDRYQGRIGRAGLDTDTPYNTYTRHGLPPTPIAMPGRAAIQAAVDPLDGDTLYFVSRGDGSHHFSRTLTEHNAAVRRYILNRSRNRAGD
ncbi:MAG: endolytic transglycosylase MltG [Lysobacteraceae bacterium]